MSTALVVVTATGEDSRRIVSSLWDSEKGLLTDDYKKAYNTISALAVEAYQQKDLLYYMELQGILQKMFDSQKDKTWRNSTAVKI